MKKNEQLTHIPAIAVMVLLVLGGATTLPAQVTDVNPDGLPGEPRFGGRTLGVTIHPLNRNVVYAASERGGFYVSADGGTTWAHIDEIPVPLARDILFDPRDPSVLIASGRSNTEVPNRGGIWVSGNGGASWTKPATSDPGCSGQVSTWGIAIADHPTRHRDVYVATDCGISISNDSGATWNHVDPCTTSDATWCNNRTIYFDVEARVVGANVQLDVCGDEGFFRSTDGGATWSAPDPNSPARRVNNGSFNPCNVATAPQNADTVYLANYSGTTPAGFCQARLMENASGGAAGGWVSMNVGSQNCRDPWVVNQPDPGNADRFFVYYGDSQRVRRQRCNIGNSPRCSTGAANWPTFGSGLHSDPSDWAFDPASPNCALVASNDGGLATSVDCGANWQDGNRGLHALDVVAHAGTLQGGGTTDLYAGTQDNGFYVSENNAATWTRPVGADGYGLMADLTPPARVFFRVCFGCSNHIADPGFSGSVGFNDPPGTIPSFAIATQFGPERYAFLTNDGGTPAQWTAWVTTNEGTNWTQLGPSPLPGGGQIKSAGPAASPTFYLRLGVAGQPRMFRLSGSLDSTATLTPINTGLSSPSNVWDVDPSDPTRLYVYDSGFNQMRFSTNSGGQWFGDTELTSRITQGGSFTISPTGITFDPWSSQIVVGTQNAGLVVSVNDGETWNNLENTELLSHFTRFFFDPDNEHIFGFSKGRGIWQIALTDAQVQVPGDVDLGETCRGEISTGTLDVCNTGTDNLSVSGIASSNSRFAVTEPSAGYPVAISPDFCFPFQVTFDPILQGSQAGTLAISSNDLDDPEVEIGVSGEGTVQDIRVTGSTNFGVGSAWRADERTVSVCNAGDCDLAVTAASVGCTDFSLIDNPFPASLAPGSCLGLTARFTSIVPGSKNCVLSVNSNDPDTLVVQRTLTGKTPPLFSLRSGLAGPHAALSAVARQGSTFNLGFVYPFLPRWAWTTQLGHSSFDGRAAGPDVDVWYLSANTKFTVNPVAPARFFLNGGLGVYHPDPGDFEGGGNLGLGVDIPIGQRFIFEASYDYHLAFTASPDLEFRLAQAGFLVSF